MKVYIVWHWLKYNEQEIEAVFLNEQDAVEFCDARKNRVIPGYCNYGFEPEYTWSIQYVFGSLEEYKNKIEREREEEKQFEDWISIINDSNW